MNRLQAISKRILSANISKRIVAASVRLGIFIFLFATSSAASALEAIAKLLGKALQDNASASDAPSKAVSKASTDAAAGSDSTAKTLGKNVFDQPLTNDSQNLSFFKVLSNPSFAADNIALLAAFLRSFSNTTTASDAPVLLAGKVSADTSQASDAQVKLSTMVKSDTIASTDAGTLLNQDYVDNAFYFADDYVGVKRTF